MPSDRMGAPPRDPQICPILKAVALEPQHGWAISERLHQISSASLQIRQAPSIPLFTASSGADGSRRAGARRRTIAVRSAYELTRRGRAELEAQTTAWHRLAATIGQVLKTV